MGFLSWQANAGRETIESDSYMIPGFDLLFIHKQLEKSVDS